MIASHARSCAVRGGALRGGLSRQVCGAMRVQSFATGGAVTHAEPLVSDLVLRALLRNMKLLVGQRGDKKRFKVLLVAPHDVVGNHLAKLEPALDIQSVRMGASFRFASAESLSSRASRVLVLFGQLPPASAFTCPRAACRRD